MLLQLNIVQALTNNETNPITPPITNPIPSPSPTPEPITGPIPSPSPTPTPTPTPDTQNPTVSITYPLYGSFIKKNNVLDIQASASDNVAISKVEFYVNNNLICIDTTSPYICSWFVGKKPRVTYTISAKAYDTSNNTASHSITVTSK